MSIVQISSRVLIGEYNVEGTLVLPQLLWPPEYWRLSGTPGTQTQRKIASHRRKKVQCGTPIPPPLLLACSGHELWLSNTHRMVRLGHFAFVCSTSAASALPVPLPLPCLPISLSKVGSCLFSTQEEIQTPL